MLRLWARTPRHPGPAPRLRGLVVPMRKPKALKAEAETGAVRKPPAKDGSDNLKERRQLIELEIRALRNMLQWLRSKMY